MLIKGIKCLLKFKGIFLFVFMVFAVLSLSGSVSAANLTVDEVGYGSTAVVSQTQSNGYKIPGYVKVNGENSTSPSFLYTLTKTTVQVNQNVKTPVAINSVGAAPSPSGSATGNLTKSQYITIANNVKSFISSNGRAPNYASSPLGNIRYESLVYFYAKIMRYYKINGQLPSTMNVLNIPGTTGGANIQDTTPPTVTASPGSGAYNTTKSVILTANDNADSNPAIYYTKNGSTPTTSSTKYTAPIVISTTTTLKFIAADNMGNQAVVQSRTYNITTPQTTQALLNIEVDNVLSLPSRTTGLNISQQINLTDPVTWVSVVYHHVDEPGICEVNVIVNGNIILTKWFANSYFLWFDEELWWFEYGDPTITGVEINPNLFMGYGRLLNFAEQNGQDLGGMLQEMYNDPDLTEGDRYMAYYHRDSFCDNINTTLTYSGRSLTKNETITYINEQNAGFEIIQSFAIATTKVTDDMVQYWLNKNSTYPVGYMKASYGTFMTALTTLWLSDKLADEIAPQLNITWSRNMFTVVMGGVTGGTGYVHCQDPAMGMGVNGGADNTKSFRFVCSLLLSEIEQGVLGSTGVSINSTVSGVVSSILAGEPFSITFDTQNNTATLTLDNDARFKIIIDLTTGVVKDILDNQGFQLKGAETMSPAYCYHGPLTDNVGQYAQNFYDGFKESGAEGVAGGLLITAGLIAFGACPPLGLLLLAGGLIISADASGLFQDPTNPYNWVDFGASVGLSLAGPEAVTLKAAITPTFKQAMKWSVKEVGYKKTIVQGMLGGNSGEAIKTVTTNWIYGETMSKTIDKFR